MSGDLLLPLDVEARLRMAEDVPVEPKSPAERIKGALDDIVVIRGIDAAIERLSGESHGLSRAERKAVIFRLVWRKEEELASQAKERETDGQS